MKMGPRVLEIAIILKKKKPFLFYGKTFFYSHCIILSSSATNNLHL